MKVRSQDTGFAPLARDRITVCGWHAFPLRTVSVISHDLDTPGNSRDQNLTRNIQIYNTKMAAAAKQVFNDRARIVSDKGGCR